MTGKVSIFEKKIETVKIVYKKYLKNGGLFSLPRVVFTKMMIVVL